MKTNVKTCLFGGALLGAGLCSPAAAGDVDWSFGFGFAYNIANFGSDIGIGGWDADVGDGTHSIGGTFGLDIAANGATNGYAYAFVDGYFTVATDTTLLLSWDIEIGYADVNGFGFNFEAFDGDTGSLEVTFLQGVEYEVRALLYDFGGAPSSFTMNTVTVVPLPPAAIGGLAMLAGLGAYRRVRR